MVHIFIRKKKKSLNFVVINLKGEKSIDPFELETAEGFFFFPPEVKLWSHIKHTYIHRVFYSQLHSQLQDLPIQKCN